LLLAIHKTGSLSVEGEVEAKSALRDPPLLSYADITLPSASSVHTYGYYELG
jgi:hypothetical protein